MQYDVGNLLDRIAQLERDVRQLQVSPRTGLFNSVIATSGPTTVTDVPDVWTDFPVAGPAVTLQTGTRALVLYKFRPEIWLGGYKYQIVYMGVAVSGATTRAAGVGGAIVGDIFAGVASQYIRSTVTGFELVTGLTPGDNTFTCKQYVSAAGAGGVNPIYDRQICVIPLDI